MKVTLETPLTGVITKDLSPSAERTLVNFFYALNALQPEEELELSHFVTKRDSSRGFEENEDEWG